MKTEELMRKLVIVWSDFESRLNKVDIIERISNHQIRLEDYQMLLTNHYQQVIEGGRWIARAASSITQDYDEIRSLFINHAVTEHRDYLMLKSNYEAVGGDLKYFESGQKNIGTEALNAWMFYRASHENPFDILGAMYIVEGLGKSFARKFSEDIKQALSLNEEQVSFYSYHADHDEDHLEELSHVLQSGILEMPDMPERIIKTAKVTARLYILQLEEIGNY